MSAMPNRDPTVRNTDSLRSQELVERPGESLSVELKRWIDPKCPEGEAKIVKTALALRNYGGGSLVIGFDNDSLEPDTNNAPQDVKVAFHIDVIQGLISKYASQPFEVTVEFPEREGQPYPVITVPPGVETPVAAKSDLRSGDRTLINVNDVYTRSLRANNMPSTTKATWKDWPDILKVCFDNREADIGRFLRRHLTGTNPQVVREFLETLTSDSHPKATTEDCLRKYLQECEDRYSEVVEERQVQLPHHGAWEVGLLIDGDVPSHSASQEFLNLLRSSNPRHTGWPVWLDSGNFYDESTRPYVFKGAWEALLVFLDSDVMNVIDFMRLSPEGRFYLRQAFEHDIRNSPDAPAPMTCLDFTLPIRRVAESVSVGIAFAKAMGCDPEKTQLAFGFQWSNLKGRQLVSWIEPMRHILPQRAYQDRAITFVVVPLETPPSAFGEFVNSAVQPLYEIFDGFSLKKTQVEYLTRRTIEIKFS